jgi:hypothetical protein
MPVRPSSLADRQEGVLAASPDKTGGCRRFPFALELLERFAHGVERGRILRIGFDAGNSMPTGAGEPSSTCGWRTWCRPFIRPVAQCVARHALAGDADDAEFVRQQLVAARL